MFKSWNCCFLALSLAVIVINGAHSKDSIRDLSDSVRQSKKQGTFIRLIQASPENFTWEGHDVRIQESWLETFPDGKDTSLMFRLAFSDKGMRESSLRGSYPCFVNEDKTVEEKYAPSDFTTRGLANYFLGGRSGKVVHFMRMKDPIPSQVQLRVGTYRTVIENPAASEKRMSSTILTFDLKK